jgi:4a-hydroxytetrahydrobiopterin dehydratase
MWAPGSGAFTPVLDSLVGVRDLDLPEGGEGLAHCVRFSRVAAYSPMALLSDAEIEECLQALPEWAREGNAIRRIYECGDFVGSTNFVAEIVEPAESMGHHPDLEISWDKVTVTISTHSEGGLTAADFELAAEIDSRYPND